MRAKANAEPLAAPHAQFRSSALLVYAWVGTWGVVQALPFSILDPFFEPLRPLASLAFALNAAWFVMIAHELYWLAFVVAFMYARTLFALVALSRVSTGKALASIKRPNVWRLLIGQHCFSANAAWAAVVTLLQLEINLQQLLKPLSARLSSFNLLLSLMHAS